MIMNDIESKMIHLEQVVAQQQSGQTIKQFCSEIWGLQSG